MANLFLDALPIDRFYRDKLNQIFGIQSSLVILEGQYDEPNKIVRGQCRLYGIEQLTIELKIDPTATVALAVTLTRAGTAFSISGLEWLSMTGIQLALTIPKDLSQSPTGTISATLAFPAIILRGVLEEQLFTGFNGQSNGFEWRMVSPNITDIPFDSIIKNATASPLATVFEEVKGLLSSVVQKIEIILSADYHTIVLDTPFSFNITNALKLDQIKACLSTPNSPVLETSKKLALKGTFENAAKNGFQISLEFGKHQDYILYELDILSVGTQGLSLNDVLGGTTVQEQSAWLPMGWSAKLSNTSLKSLSIQYVPTIGRFQVASQGVFLDVPTAIQFSRSRFLGNPYFTFSANFSKAPVSIQEILSNDLGIPLSIEVRNALPAIKVALTELGFDQLNSIFRIAANIELGATDPIKVHSDLTIQWYNGIDLYLAMSFYGAPLTFARLLSSLGLDLSAIRDHFPQKMTDHIFATSFQTLGLGINTKTKAFAFLGKAKIFGEWDVAIDFKSHLSGEKRFLSFGAEVSGLEISFREMPKTLGLADGTESWVQLIPDIGVSPKLLRFDQESKTFALGVDFRFSEAVLRTSLEIIPENGTERRVHLSFISDTIHPVSFVGLLKTLLPSFSIKETDVPFDLFLDEVNLNFNSSTKDSRISGIVKGYLRLAQVRILLSATSADKSENEWQFTGIMASGSVIPIGAFMAEISQKFGATDLPKILSDVTITNLNIAFNTKSKDFSFSYETQIALESKMIDVVINLSIIHNNQSFVKKFTGILKVGNLEFDLVFNQTQEQNQASETVFLAAYENSAGKDQQIKDLVALLTDNADLLAATEGMTFNLKDALLVIDKGVKTKVLFGLDIGGGLDLSKLPLVGKMLPDKSTVRLTFQPLLTNDAFDAPSLTKIRALVPTGGYQLPQEATKGIGFNMQLLIGEQKTDLNLPINVDAVKNQTPTTQTPTTTTAVPPATSADIKWFVIQKQMGPLSISRVGVQFQNSELYFLLDASLALAGLTISLDGLFVSSKLNPIAPKFGLHGLGIDYKKGPLEIGGAFLRNTLKDKDGNTYDTYDGTAIIRTSKFALAALGSYAYYQGHPSLFIYAFLDVPLGGPPFLFVTGLAAGFGYNRRIIMPGIDGVRNFPLVAEVMSDVPNAPKDLTTMLNNLHNVMPPAVGEYFFAIGLRFSSFKIIDSFVLLSVSFGLEFEIDVLGLSTLIIPTPDAGKNIEPLAEVQMALQAVFNPEKGYLKVQAALTPASFILSRNCHLIGGFAFYTWFKDNPEEGASAGDFVLTMGGYHPRFKPPSYYPKVAPLGFNWQVTDQLLIKGDFYFALVPTAVMAGGHLSATWNSGNLKAWFNIGADFIISWKPYFYDASVYVDMGVSYTFHFFGSHTISVDVGADLHIWGPEFSGKARVHLWIVSFDVSFGANTKPEPVALNWDGFRNSFLPHNSKWESVAVTKGLVNQLGTKEDPIFIINPTDFLMETSSAFPITTAKQNVGDSNKNIHIGSMKIADTIVSTHDITIKLGDRDVTTDFTFTPVKKHVPSALWGSTFNHSTTVPESDGLIKNVCMGFSIQGKPVVPSVETHSIATQKLLNKLEPFSKPIAFATAPVPMNNTWLKSGNVLKTVAQGIETKDTARNTLLQSLGFRETYHPNNTLVDEFVITSA